MHTTPNLPSNGKTIEQLKLQLTENEMELLSLLEITKSINSNLPESSLYKIFHFTLLGNLKIKKLALFVQDSDWVCKVCYGSVSNANTLPKGDFMGVMTETTATKNCGSTSYSEFEAIIPIAHKDKVLAYLLVGGLDTKNYEIDKQLDFVKTYANILLVAIENKKLARKQLQQEALRKEMEIAREVQTMLFPKYLPNNNTVQIIATYLPNLSIGGDYYDYIQIDTNSFLVCIADVSGKGIAAALLMSNFQSALRTLLRQTTDLKQIVNELNYSVSSNAKGEKFVTFFMALINTQDKTITYINAGHNPPVLINNIGTEYLLEKGCTVLGAFDKLPIIEQETLAYYGGSKLFCYTDGLTETNNNDMEEFGPEGVSNYLTNVKDIDPTEAHEQLIKLLNEYKGNTSFPDDITYLSIMLK